MTSDLPSQKVIEKNNIKMDSISNGFSSTTGCHLSNGQVSSGCAKASSTPTTTTTSISTSPIQQSERLVNRRQARKLAKFYENKNILITGASGFIGKVCLVKLLTSLGSCNKIYLLLRSKKGFTAQQRLAKMITEEPFKTPSKANPEENLFAPLSAEVDLSKLEAAEGDMSCEGLGLSEEMKEKLCKSIDIVFNIAASVQFDAPLKQNLRDNYMGTRHLLQLATSFEKLQSLVHCSTFFADSHISHIEEKVLPLNRDCEKMAELLSWIPDSLCDSIAPQIMENRPNTYVFTKAMTENLVQKYQGRLPIAIVRPSIVTPSFAEPAPGWVDNVNGPMGLGVLASLGILRNIDWNYYGVADFIPVDLVVNCMLAVAERTPRLHPSEVKVYNCSSSSLNPITWGSAFENLRKEGLRAPPYKMLRMPIEVPKHRQANKIKFTLTKWSELLFAYFVDFILMICGQKRLLAKLTAKLHHGYEILRPFCLTEYTCSNENLLAAYNELDPDDRRDFFFDIASLNWTSSFGAAYYGSRRMLLKEDPSNIPAAVRKMRIMMVVEHTFKALFYALLGWLLFRLFTYLQRQTLLSF